MSVEKAADLADGRVWIGRESIAAGLCDRVAMFEEIVAEASGREYHSRIEQLTGMTALNRYDALVEERAAISGNRFMAMVEIDAEYPRLTTEKKKFRP